MSTSLIYHAFGVRGYRYVKTEYIKGEVVFTMELPRESYRCPVCLSEDVIGRGQKPRRFRTVGIGSKVVYVALAIPGCFCPFGPVSRSSGPPARDYYGLG
jgi:hypothetical protein